MRRVMPGILAREARPAGNPGEGRNHKVGSLPTANLGA